MLTFNIMEHMEKNNAYRKNVNHLLMDDMMVRILGIIVIQKKYKDPNYTAKKLADDLGSNIRFISAIMRIKFHSSYKTFVNKYRIEEALSILTDKRYQDLSMEDVGSMVGFPNRLTFYAAFYKFYKMTPKEYKRANMPSSI